MSTHDIAVKAYEEKISAQLQQVKAQLEELEARAKGKAAGGVIDSLHHLRTKHHDIDKKRQVLKTIGDAKLEQFKAEIDAEVAKLKALLAEASAKVKAEPRAKAG